MIQVTMVAMMMALICFFMVNFLSFFSCPFGQVYITIHYTIRQDIFLDVLHLRLCIENVRQ